MQRTLVLYFFLIACAYKSSGQDSIAKKLTVSAYIEAYYSYDLGEPSNHLRPSFFYSYNRHNEVNLNLGYIKANYTTEAVRGNFALMAGTYANYNLASEPILLRNVFEANAGIKLLKKSQVWLDAGILPSHIGFESAIGKDCWTLTRSILADNSPYYEAGARISYTNKSEKLYLSALYLNGWQRIQRVPGNQTPAFGSQITLKPSEKLSFNWSTYIGNERPDSLQRWRYFHNLYAQWQLHKAIGLIFGFDIGYEQTAKHSKYYYNWYAPVLIAQLKTTEKTRLAARAEYYKDSENVVVKAGTRNGFATAGYSLNFDYLPSANVLLRVEGRALSSVDKIFDSKSTPSKENYFFTSAITLSF